VKFGGHRLVLEKNEIEEEEKGSVEGLYHEGHHCG
jgi:hypothetical protein